MNIKTQSKDQIDLFDQAQAADKKMKRKTKLLLPDVKNSFTVSYETLIFYIIVFVMMCIVSFSLGVEKGRYDEKKRRAMFQQELTRDPQPQPKPELKKGVSNVPASKSKNVKLR